MSEGLIIDPSIYGMGDMLKHLATYIASKLPVPWGFCLIVFKYNTPKTPIMFVSSAQKEGLIKMLKTYVEELEKTGHA